MPEPVCGEFPKILLTGRGSSAQWHTQTRTGKSPVLAKLVRQEAYAEIHPSDAERLGIEGEGAGAPEEGTDDGSDEGDQEDDR